MSRARQSFPHILCGAGGVLILQESQAAANLPCDYLLCMLHTRMATRRVQEQERPYGHWASSLFDGHTSCTVLLW
jgi:hypothetical protein